MHFKKEWKKVLNFKSRKNVSSFNKHLLGTNYMPNLPCLHFLHFLLLNRHHSVHELCFAVFLIKLIEAHRASLVAQSVKCLSTMRETWVPSLGREDLLEKEMAIHSNTIAWKIPWTEEPGRLQSMGSQRVGHDWATSLSLSLTFITREGNGTLLQYSWPGES